MDAPIQGQTSSDEDLLFDVALVGIPVELWQQATADHDEMYREFRLMTAHDVTAVNGTANAVSNAIVDLQQRGIYGKSVEDHLHAALRRGEKKADLSISVSRSTRDFVAQFVELLRIADEYCRNGELLMRDMPAQSIAFREWYLGEFVRQIDGEPPTSWNDRDTNIR